MNSHSHKIVAFFSFLILFAILQTAQVMAQYGDAYHAPNNYLIEKNQREYGEKMRNDIRSQSNTKSLAGVASGNESAELAAKWKATWDALKNKNKPLTESDLYIKKLDDDYRAKRKSDEEAIMRQIYANEREQTRQYEALTKPYIIDLMAAGFTENEAARMANGHIINYQTLKKYPQADNVAQLGEVLKGLNANKDNLDFQTLSNTLELLYFYAPFSTLKIIDNIKNRFPDKVKELDNMTINALEGYYGNGFRVDEKLIADKYFALLTKYPDIATPFLKNIYAVNKSAYDPYQVYMSENVDKNSSKWAKMRADHLAGGIDDFFEKRKNRKGVKEIMDDSNLSLSDIIFMDLPYEFKTEYQKIYTEQAAIFDMEVFRDFKLLCQDGYYLKTFYSLAQEGNEDAIKLYAASIGNGWGNKQGANRKEMFFNLLKWAEKGYYSALVMCFRTLTRDTQYGYLPYATDAIATANKSAHLYSPAQLQALGNLLAQTNTYLWFGRNFELERGQLPQIKKFGQSLLKK